jgi:hypothetical protein
MTPSMLIPSPMWSQSSQFSRLQVQLLKVLKVVSRFQVKYEKPIKLSVYDRSLHDVLQAFNIGDSEIPAFRDFTA